MKIANMRFEVSSRVLVARSKFGPLADVDGGFCLAACRNSQSRVRDKKDDAESWKSWKRDEIRTHLRQRQNELQQQLPASPSLSLRPPQSSYILNGFRPYMARNGVGNGPER